MTKLFETLWIFDSKRDNSANWREADPLHFARFAFAPFEKRESYRDSGAKSLNFAKFLQFEMQLELANRISNGECIAIGIQVSPIPKSEPEVIPPVYFVANEIDIDWENDSLSGLGRSFHEVRICLPASPNYQSSDAIAPITANGKRGGGRPSQYSKAKAILEILFRDERYKTLPATKLIARFNDEFAKHFERPDLRIAPMSERSLRNHLVRYRKELEKTGNN